VRLLAAEFFVSARLLVLTTSLKILPPLSQPKLTPVLLLPKRNNNKFEREKATKTKIQLRLSGGKRKAGNRLELEILARPPKHMQQQNQQIFDRSIFGSTLDYI